MIIRSRALSPSTLKRLSLISSCFALTSTPQTSISPCRLRPPSCKSQFLFSTTPNRPPAGAASTGSHSFSLNRDGNYKDGTPSSAICPGCGVHMQDSDPKHPGFFLSPSMKSKDLVLKSGNKHLVPVSTEPEFSFSLKRGLLPPENDDLKAVNENPDGGKPEKPVVCARCHSLRHYGKVKDPSVENLLPEFDFDHTVGRKLTWMSGAARSVILMVVDASDFDGSFPRTVAKLISRVTDENWTAWKEGKSGNVPRIILVVTKIDLLPTSLSPTRFEHWVRLRAREGGALRLSGLHFVSAVRDWGVKNLVEEVTEMAGPRGTVWAVGSQNAGKSTLINAIAKSLGKKVGFLTEAPVPGTTLGIVRVEGLLPGQAKLFDTPGLLNSYQITTRLTREEQKLVYVGKELKPRTYRIKAGHTVHIAGLMRLDVEELSVDSIYVTVWASCYLPLHMGKTESAQAMLEDHFGQRLQPPIGEKRVRELGNWVRREFHVSGNSWDSSCVDVAAAGLGWFSIGVKGEAVFGVWTYEGVEVVLRNALISERAKIFEESGFSVSKIVATADQALNKSHGKKEKKRKQSEGRTAVLASTAGVVEPVEFS